MKSSKPPPPTPEQLQVQATQRRQAALLDDEENKRRKRLLGAAQGVRAFRGSAMFRAKPSDTAAAAPASAPAIDTRSSLLPDYGD